MAMGGLIVLNLDAEATFLGKLRATDLYICSWVHGEKHSKAVVLADLSLFILVVLVVRSYFRRFHNLLFVSSFQNSTLCVSLS